MIRVGDRIDTSIELDVVEGGEERRLSLQDLLTRPTIVSVYMKNNSGSCDKQNVSLARVADAVDRLGYNVVALGKDSCRSHVNYAAKLRLSYTLASDPNHRFAEAADAMVAKKMRGKTYMGPARSAYVLDTDGTVLARIEKVSPAHHGDEVRRLVETLQDS